MTLAGVSSPHSTSSACSAAVMAASKPAACSRCASRASARATNPLETGVPSSASISAAVRSTGTLPSEDSGGVDIRAVDHGPGLGIRHHRGGDLLAAAAPAPRQLPGRLLQHYRQDV